MVGPGSQGPSGSPLENLRAKPKDQRVAIAEGVAITVVIVLFLAWGLYFFRKIQSGSQQVNLESSSAQNDFNFTNVKEAQQQLKTIYGDVSQDLRDLRDQAQQAGLYSTQQVDQSGDQPREFHSLE